VADGLSGLQIAPVQCDDATNVPDSQAGRPRTRIGSIHPNPFNPQATIVFNVSDAGRVRITVHDLAGRQLAILADARFEMGRQVLTWDSMDDRRRQLSSGVYFLHLEANGVTESRKLTLTK